MTTAAIYARKSDDNPENVESQIKDAAAFIAKQGWARGPAFSDTDISGAKFERPGLNALLHTTGPPAEASASSGSRHQPGDAHVPDEHEGAAPGGFVGVRGESHHRNLLAPAVLHRSRIGRDDLGGDCLPEADAGADVLPALRHDGDSREGHPGLVRY